MHTTTRRVRHAAAVALTGTLLAGGAITLTAGPAVAEGDHSPSCTIFGGSDDGLITDPVHHYVEPLATGDIRDGLHHVNCRYVENVEYMITPGYVKDVIDTVNYAVNGPQYTLPLVGTLPKLPALLPGFKLPGGR